MGLYRSGDLPNPGIEPRSPALQADALPSEPPGKPIDSSDVANLSLWWEMLIMGRPWGMGTGGIWEISVPLPPTSSRNKNL